MKYCKDYPGECCGSCHEDMDYGYDLLDVYNDDGDVVAMVCCTKHDAACAIEAPLTHAKKETR